MLGVTYDTGFLSEGTSTHTNFDPARVYRARGMFIVEWEGARAVRLIGSYERDESEGSQYFNDSFNVFEEAGVDAAFWCTFAAHNLPYDEDHIHDFDRASYGIVRVLQEGRGTTYPDMPWEPKEVFYTIAARYAALRV
jgi:hypothetical protein